jgi:asparagine synthase (glutamine-hydrolysing)
MKFGLFKDDLLDQVNASAYRQRDALQHLQSDVSHLDPVTQMLFIDTRANLPDDLLMVCDKTSMANSLEARVPFLDYRLVEFIEKIPSRLKLRGLTGKYLHKRALRKWLPKDIVYRKKKGFSNPVEKWFRHSMSDFVEEYLLSSNSGSAQFFDQNYIRRMIEIDRRGHDQLRRHIYLLVSFEMWYRTFIIN